ncbi:MAG: radical SAM protein [Polyangiaceae bacterium]|nr:radical SAM protein [Polyangiaceae bacterium]
MKRSLDIELTRRCNLRCDYCFVGWSRDWHTDMPLPAALGVVRDGAGLFPMLHITGGEPFAYSSLFEVIEAGLEHGYEEILVNSNGTMITPEIARRLASYGDSLAISVSLDGPAPVHDAARGEGRFQAALSGLSALLDRGVRASVMTVITPVVLVNLTEFIRDLRKELPGLAGFTLFPVGVGPVGSQKPGVDLRPLTPDELRELALTVALLYRTGIPVGIGAYPIVNPLLLAFGYPSSALYQCTAGRGRVCVHADLTVSPCHPVKEAVYGTYRPGLLRDLCAAAPEGSHERLARRDFEGCNDCRHNEVCGNCRAFVTASGAPLYGNDGVCQDVLPQTSLNEAKRRRVSLPVL